MKSNSKHTVSRYLLIVIFAAVIGLIVVAKAGYEMVARSEYWETVRGRLASQQKDVPAVRGNI